MALPSGGAEIALGPQVMRHVDGLVACLFDRLAQLRRADMEDLAPVVDVHLAEQVDRQGRALGCSGSGLVHRARSLQTFAIETERTLRYASTASGPPSEP